MWAITRNYLDCVVGGGQDKLYGMLLAILKEERDTERRPFERLQIGTRTQPNWELRAAALVSRLA